mgnify:CR=1 FL=1
MRVEVAYRGRIEAFDTDRFTERSRSRARACSPILRSTTQTSRRRASGSRRTATPRTRPTGQTAERPPRRGARRAGGSSSPPRERPPESRASPWTLDGAREALRRARGRRQGRSRLRPLRWARRSLASRIVRLSGYLANDDERLAASQALMAEAVGVTPLTLERAVEAEAAQEVPADDMEDDWMEGFGND